MKYYFDLLILILLFIYFFYTISGTICIEKSETIHHEMFEYIHPASLYKK